MNKVTLQSRWAIWLLLVYCVSLRLLGAGRTISGQYVVRPWRSSDGVAVWICRCLAQDADHALWAGTFDGVYRLAGERATRFTPEVSTGYHSGWFISLLGRRDRSLWAGTGEGVRRFEKGEWISFPASANSPPGLIEWLAEAPDGKVYASSGTNSYVWDGQVFAPFSTPYRRPGDTSPARFVFDEAGVLWARTDSVLAQYQAGEWKTILAPDSTKGWIRGICAARRGGVWVATDTAIMRFRGDEVDRVTPLPELLRGDWLQLFQDTRGSVWIGGLETGLAVLEAGGRMLGGVSKGDLPVERIFCFAEDHEGNVYAGSNGQGLYQIRPRRAFPLVPDGLGPEANPDFNAIVTVGPDSLLVATTRGRFYQVSSSRHSIERVESPISDSESIALLADHGGHLWVATQSREQTGELWRSPNLRPGELEKWVSHSESINALYEDRQHNLLVGTRRGLFALHGKTLEPIPMGEGGNREVICFASDGGDRFWIGTSSGLFELRHGLAEPVHLPTIGDVKASVVALHVDHFENLWVGLNDGTLLVLRGDRWTTLPRGEPFHSPGIAILTDDKNGRLWVGGRFGLSGFSVKEAIDYVDGVGPVPLVIRLTGSDDLAVGEDFSGTGSSGWGADELGALWFANEKALFKIDPSAIQVNRLTSDVWLTEILVGNRSIVAGRWTNHLARLPHGASPVVLKYESSGFTAFERTEFEYRLDSNDQKWTFNGRSRELGLAGLSPGRHTIEIRAINGDGVRPGKGAVFQIEIERYFYETWWFRGATLTVALTQVFVVGRRGLKRYIGKREALLAAREAAARAELNRVSLEADRMRLEARLHESQRLEALGTLAGGIAHDFNNLLQTILGNAELGRLSVDTPRVAEEHLVEVAKAAERARALVAQILLFSRRDKPRRIPLYAGPVVKETLKMLRSGIPPAVEFDLSVPDNLPPILGDPSAVQRIITNLGTNAAHAMRAHGGKLSVRLSAVQFDEQAAQDRHLAKLGKYLCLRVEDTGHGMDPGTLRRVFEPFFTTKPPGEGTGLGLSVVQGLVQSLEGGIQVRSQVGAGTVFEIYLPATDETPRPQDPPRTLTAPPVALRIMIVDDDRAVLDFAVIATRRLGHVVEGFGDPELALERFKRDQQHFDLILTDLTMPGMDGRELAEAIHSLRPGIPVILATGYGEGMDEAAALSSGFAALIPKPYNIDALITALARVALSSSKPT